MKILKKIIITIITLILFCLMSYNIYNLVCTKVLNKDITSIYGYSILEVVSGSMEPTIHVGDLIIIKNEKKYKANDIVTFKDVNGSFVTHRIISIKNDEMITKGDNNNSEDEATKINKIVGKFVFKINNGGKILEAFKSPLVLIMIFIVGIMMCFLISTDKDCKPILTEEEKEFEEFLKKKKK